MKEKQNHKIKMYFEVSAVMEKHVEAWSKISEIKNTYDEFITNNDKIIELKNEYERDISPVIADKAKKREALINNAVPISNILQVYAYDENDKNLAKTINFSRNKLTKSKDAELIDKCNIIWKTAKKLYGKSLSTADDMISNNKKPKQASANISGYGLTGQMIDDLEEANKAFIEAILALKDAISHKNKSAKKLNDNVKSNDKLLRNKLDRLMTLFETTQEGFYKKYRNARAIKIEGPEIAAEKEGPKEEEKQEKVQSMVAEQKEQKGPDTEKKEGTKATNEKATGTSAKKTASPSRKPTTSKSTKSSNSAAS